MRSSSAASRSSSRRAISACSERLVGEVGERRRRARARARRRRLRAAVVGPPGRRSAALPSSTAARSGARSSSSALDPQHVAGARVTRTGLARGRRLERLRSCETCTWSAFAAARAAPRPRAPRSAGRSRRPRSRAAAAARAAPAASRRRAPAADPRRGPRAAEDLEVHRRLLLCCGVAVTEALPPPYRPLGGVREARGSRFACGGRRPRRYRNMTLRSRRVPVLALALVIAAVAVPAASAAGDEVPNCWNRSRSIRGQRALPRRRACTSRPLDRSHCTRAC